MIPESLDEAQDSEILITSWNRCHGTQAYAAAHSPGWRHHLYGCCSIQAHSSKNYTHTPALSLLPTASVSPQEPTTEGSPSPDHPARSPQLICLTKNRWGGISGEAAPGLLILPWQTPVVSRMPSRSRGVPDGVCGQHRRADGFGEADVSDGAVTVMPTHPLPPMDYF